MLAKIEHFSKGYTREWLGCIVATWVFLLSISVFAAEPIRGIYGVPSIKNVDPSSYVGKMEKGGINAVFVPPEKETVKWFKAQGNDVYVSVNAFGGKGAWKDHPDSRPVKSDGSYLGSAPGYKGHGGVCPTHTGWRRERLKYIESLVREFGGEGGIDGIWLDFVRYPGLWEVPEPEIPDTCYCPRCLYKFQKDRKIEMPTGLSPMDAASWIKGNCPYQWVGWKKAQIASFVSETRDVMEKNRGKRQLKLGLFLVPWTKGERGNAISYLLGQDAFQLSGLVDVISPMVYHKMCGRSSAWVGYMCSYYSETAKSLLWPIVQSVDCTADEFENTVGFAGQGGSDGILIYSFNGMGKGFWERLGSTDYADEKVRGLEGEKKEVAVTAVDEWGAEWVVPLGECETGEEYQFRAEFYRDGWRNGVYPEVSLWGKEFRVDTHLKAKVFQPIRVNVVCPDEISDPYFRFINRNRGTTFRMVRPSLKRHYRFTGEPEIVPANAFFPGHFFPIGVYGADLENLEQIKKLAINTVVFGGRGDDLREKVIKCHEVGLRYVLSTPRNPDRLPPYLRTLSEYVRPYDLAFYVNDEPGIWSFPMNRANDINRLIKDRFPGSATCMAVVRPQVCRDFEWAADFFMLDQYPVPYMPMTWLSDCMDECAGRLGSVIQAFGGEKYADVGWPIVPTWQEMDCLAFLSVVHGSRGIFFYTFNWIGKTKEGRKRLARVVGRLNRVYPWLVAENSEERLQVEMLSENRFDPKGRAAVHCCLKRKGKEWMVIAVNTIGTYVAAFLGVEGEKVRRLEVKKRRKVQEVFSGEDYPLVEGKIRVKFGPYETKAFLFSVDEG